MIVEITTAPGEYIEDLQPIKDAIRALGHSLEFIEQINLDRDKDYGWKLECRSPGAAEKWRQDRK